MSLFDELQQTTKTPEQVRNDQRNTILERKMSLIKKSIGENTKKLQIMA